MSMRENDFDSDSFRRLFDFVYPDEEHMLPDDVEKELNRLHIDIGPIMSRLEIKLSSLRQRQEAQQKLKSANQERLAMLAKLKGLKSTILPNSRNELKELINRLFGQAGAHVYARRLEEAASDDDLRSLIEDIQRLDALGLEQSDGSS